MLAAIKGSGGGTKVFCIYIWVHSHTYSSVDSLNTLQEIIFVLIHFVYALKGLRTFKSVVKHL